MELVIPPGISRGASQFDRPGRWYDCNLVRWRDGRLEPVGGWQRITGTPLASTPRRILAVRDNSDIKRFLLGCHNHILVYEGAAVTDVTPASFVGFNAGGSAPDGYGIGLYSGEDYGTPRSVGDASLLRAPTISLDAWGEDVLCVYSTDGRLLHYDASAPTADMTVISGAPTNNRAMVVTPERFVMLIGAGGDPRKVQWSSQETFDFVPTPTNTAGDLQLESDGLLVSATEVRDGILVHSDSDAWIIRYVGSPFVFGRERVGEGISLLSPNTIARVGGGAVWMGKNGFWLYDAGVCKPLPCDVAEAIFSDIDPTYGITRSHASANGLFQEITFFWPSVGSTECDRYAIWNYAEGWWSLGRLSRTTMTPAGVHGYPLAGDAEGHLYEHENGWTDAGASRVGDIWIESSGFTGAGTSAVFRVQADGDGADVGGTEITFYARTTRDGAETEFGPYVARTDGWTPTRAGGRHLRMRLEPTADGAWSVGRPILDVRQVGDRG